MLLGHHWCGNNANGGDAAPQPWVCHSRWAYPPLTHMGEPPPTGKGRDAICSLFKLASKLICYQDQQPRQLHVPLKGLES
jgi:hypothetical protein